MVKATRTSAVLLGVAALGLLALSTPVFAEVQNVKVSGDYTGRAFFRSNLDLKDKNGTLDDHEDFLQQLVGLNVGADLTENVSAFIRFSSESVLGKPDQSSTVRVSQSYVKLKDLFYAPFTLTLGRQPIVWGRGFVLGSGLIPNTLNGGGGTLSGISAVEFTDLTAFDAIRGTLDFQGAAAVNLPLTVDLVYIKLNENNVGQADDVNLMGFNVGSKFDVAHSEVEAYYLNKRDRKASQSASHNPGNVNTIGIRGSTAPIDGSYIYGELAYQFGQRATDASGLLPAGDAQQAWAFDLGAEYTAKEVAWTPKLGAEWIFYSGKDVDGAVAGWDPIARGYFTTALREFQTSSTIGGFYPNTQTCFVSGAGGNPCTGAQSNQHQFSVYGSVKPLNDLTIAPRLSFFTLDRGAIPVAGSKRRGYAGTEWDTQVIYNYTDDVQFGLIYALFGPGNVYRTPNDATAQELVSTVSVKF